MAKFFIALYVSLLALPCFARRTTDADASVLSELDSTVFEVYRDGTYVAEFESIIRIVNDAGRVQSSTQSVTFNSHASKFQLLEASTDNEGVVQKVPSAGVQIRDAGEAKGFDIQKNVVISYPAVRVGSRLKLKYRLRLKETPTQGHFSTAFWLGLETKSSLRVKFRSEVPLFYHLIDPKGVLRVTSGREGSKWLIDITTSQPYLNGVVEEEAPFLASERASRIVISSLDSWKEFGAKIIDQQEILLAKPLPPKFQRIRDSVIELPPEKRMDSVAALVAEEIRYFGDWRHRNGTHVPRELEDIAESGYGDCKDMSLAIVAIARAMGLKADIAWVYRSLDAFSDGDYKLPSDVLFNHAVARVEDGGTRWLDSTNSVILKGQPYSDIAGRLSFVASKGGGWLDRIPAVATQGSSSKINISVRLNSNGLVSMKGVAEYIGRAGAPFAWQLINEGAESFRYSMANVFARGEKLESYDMGVPFGIHRVFDRFRVEGEVVVAGLGMRTTAGIGFPIFRSNLVDPALVDVGQRESDIWLGEVGISDETYTLENLYLVGSEDLGCDIKSPWINASRSVQQEGSRVRVHSRYEILKDSILHSEFTQASFQKFQRQLQHCFLRSTVIVSSKAKR